MSNHNPAPEVVEDGLFAQCRVECHIDLPADEFMAWYINEPVENFMLGTLVVSPITGTEPMDGPTWGEPGSVRKIFFKDGTTSLEQILDTNFPEGYRYQPWAYTNPMRLLSDYAVSEMRAVPADNGCRIVWDYGFHARNRMALPLVNMFVKLDWQRNLTNALGVLKAHLEEHGTSRQIHEAVVKAA